MEIEAVDGPPGAVAEIAVLLEQDGGTVKEPDEAGAADAYDAPVPSGVGEDDGAVIVGSHAAVNGELFGVFRDVGFDAATIVVPVGESCGDLGGAGGIGGREQFEGLTGVSEAADGVEAGTEAEADVCGVDAFVQFRFLAQCADTDDGAAGDLLQAEAGDDAVFSQERHDVGDDAHGGEGEQFDQQGAERRVDLVAAARECGQSPRELVRDARAAEVWERIGRATGRERVHECEGFGQIGDRLGRRVVVGDDEVAAPGLGFAGGNRCGDAAVDADDEVVLVGKFGDGVAVEAVALFEAVGQVGCEANVGLEGMKQVPEDGGGRDAVNVVVGVDDDGLVALKGVEDACRGLVEVGHERWIMEIAERGVEKARVGDAAGGEDSFGKRRAARVPAGIGGSESPMTEHPAAGA